MVLYSDNVLVVQCPGKDHPAGVAPLGFVLKTKSGPVFTNGQGVYIILGTIICPFCGHKYFVRLAHRSWEEETKNPSYQWHGREVDRGALTPQ